MRTIVSGRSSLLLGGTQHPFVGNVRPTPLPEHDWLVRVQVLDGDRDLPNLSRLHYVVGGGIALSPRLVVFLLEASRTEIGSLLTHGGLKLVGVFGRSGRVRDGECQHQRLRTVVVDRATLSGIECDVPQVVGQIPGMIGRSNIGPGPGGSCVVERMI